MAKVKLKLTNKSDSELLTFSQQHIAAMVGNANFTTPAPTVVAFQTLHDDYESALDTAELAATAALEKTALKDVARGALELGISQRGNYVDLTSGGDEPKILSSNFPVRDTPEPIGTLPAPLDFLATLGDMEGEIDLTWSRVYGAKSYMVQHSPYATPRVWSQATVVTPSRATITGCTPGELCVFRVAAVGAAGQGPWSDESVKRAP
jgi:hypothetical protein